MVSAIVIIDRGLSPGLSPHHPDFKMDTSTSTTPLSGAKEHALKRFLYHLWRLDDSSRSFGNLSPDKCDMEEMKKRWEIGLVLEMVNIGYRYSSSTVLTIYRAAIILPGRCRSMSTWADDNVDQPEPLPPLPLDGY